MPVFPRRFAFTARFVAPALLAFALGPATAASPPSSPPPSFAAQTELVTVDAVVVDRRGNPVGGLTRDDFIVHEDGIPQQVESFEAVSPAAQVGERHRATECPRESTNVGPQRPIRVWILLFDDEHLSPANGERAKDAIARLLDQGMGEGDVVMLGAVSGGPAWSAHMPAGRDDLMEVLRGLKGRRPATAPLEYISEYEAMRIHLENDTAIGDRVARRFRSYKVHLNADDMSSLSETERLRTFAGINEPIVEMRAAETYIEARHRNEATLLAMQRVIAATTAVRGRKSVILLSEGFILDPSLETDRQTIDAARRANAAVYFIDARGLEGLPAFMTAGLGRSIDNKDFGGTLSGTLLDAEGAAAIAESTGGFTVRNSNDLRGGLDRIARESRSYYLLGYRPRAAERVGRYHTISVRVSRPHVTVRARRGYHVARDDDGRKRSNAELAVAPDEVLDSPVGVGGVPLRAMTHIMEATADGRARVLLTVEADIARLFPAQADGSPRNTLRMVALVVQRGSHVAQRAEKAVEMTPSPETLERLRVSWYPLDGSFELAPGVYQARVMVEDAHARIGTVIHEFEVPGLSGLRIATPILTDTLAAPEGQAATALPLARRTFLVSRPLYLQFETYGASPEPASGLPSVNAGYEIRAPNGTVVRSSLPKPIAPTADGRLSRLVGIPANVLAPGDYQLVLQVWDAVERRSLTACQSFSITSSPIS